MVSKICFSLVLLCLFFSNTYAQSHKPLPGREMSHARLLINDKKYRDALVMYYDLYDEHKNNPFINYRIAEAYYLLLNLAQARSYCDIAIQNCSNPEDYPEIFLLSAKIYHKQEAINKALKHYNKYKEITEEDEEKVDENIDKYIIQAQNALELINNQDNSIKVFNLGQKINSEFSEFSPVLSFDGSKLFFTTTNKIHESQTINQLTKEYNESILVTTRNKDGNWESPKEINAEFTVDSGFTISAFSPSLNYAYLAREVSTESDGGDIYYSKINPNYEFNKPKRFCEENINTPYYEDFPYKSFTGKLYFITDNQNITRVKPSVVQTSIRRGDWRRGRLIRRINSNHNPEFLYVHPTEKFIIIASDCEQSMGGTDLFISINNNGRWSAPQNLGYPINSTANETGFALSMDGKTAFIASDRSDGYGKTDIFEIELGDYLKNKFDISAGAVIFNGKVTDEDDNPVEAEIRIRGSNGDAFRLNTCKNGEYKLVLSKDASYDIQIRNREFERLEAQIDLKNYTGEVINEKSYILNRK